MTGSENIVEIQHLRKVFPLGKNRQQTVFKDLSLQIRRGEFVVFLGPSGCGKSTLLRLISHLESPTSGRLKVSSDRKGLVFQEPRLLAWQTVHENVMLPARLEKLTDVSWQKRADQLLSLLGLTDFAHQFPQTLSGGMKMRAALARALLLQPKLLLLDEPLAALDEQTRGNLQGELRRWAEENEDMTFIFVTHSLREACFLADRIFIFNAAGEQPQEVQVQLPSRRWGLSEDLRESQAFFDETKRLSALFHGGQA
jgi:NitT/TauT family transport system ATP-binding protein